MTSTPRAAHLQSQQQPLAPRSSFALLRNMERANKESLLPRTKSRRERGDSDGLARATSRELLNEIDAAYSSDRIFAEPVEQQRNSYALQAYKHKDILAAKGRAHVWDSNEDLQFEQEVVLPVHQIERAIGVASRNRVMHERSEAMMRERERKQAEQRHREEAERLRTGGGARMAAVEVKRQVDEQLKNERAAKRKAKQRKMRKLARELGLK